MTISFFIEDAAQSKSTLVVGLIAAATIAAIPISDINGVFVLFGIVGWTIGYTVHRVQHKKQQ